MAPISGVAVLAFDQLTKLVALQYLNGAPERVLIPGLVKCVNVGNTGMIVGLFEGNNRGIAIFTLCALAVLVSSRRYFISGLRYGELGLTFIVAGMCSNLLDRLLTTRQHVVDFIQLYIATSKGVQNCFPVFNFADVAICVGLLICCSTVRPPKE